MAITMGFTISTHQKSTRAPEQKPINLDAINTKLDRLIEESRARDTVLLQHLIGVRQQLQQGQQGQGGQGRIAEVSQD